MGRSRYTSQALFHPKAALAYSRGKEGVPRRPQGPKDWPLLEVESEEEEQRDLEAILGCGLGTRLADMGGLSASRTRECSLTDMGVASDLAKDVHLSLCGFPHLLQLLRTQPLSCHLHDLHGKLITSSPMNTAANHGAHPSGGVG